MPMIELNVSKEPFERPEDLSIVVDCDKMDENGGNEVDPSDELDGVLDF